MTTPEDALETFDRTLRDEPYENWGDWVRDLADAISSGDVASLDKYPAYVKGVYELKMSQPQQ